MKGRINYFLLACLSMLLLFCGCQKGVYFKVVYQESGSALREDFLDIVTTYAQIQEVCSREQVTTEGKNILQSYDASYFEKKGLIVYGLQRPDGRNIWVENILVEEGSVHIEIKAPNGAADCAMTYWIFVMEVHLRDISTNRSP